MEGRWCFRRRRWRRRRGYAITLPGMGRPADAVGAKGELRQAPAIDLAYDLNGVEATWKGGIGWGELDGMAARIWICAPRMR